MQPIYRAILPPSATGATSIPIDFAMVRRLRGCFQRAFREKNADEEVSEYEILVDVPWGKAGNRVLTVMSNDGREERKITDVSHLKSSIFEEPTVFLAPIRIFVSPRVYAKFEDNLTSIITAAEEYFYDTKADIDVDGLAD